MSHLYYTFAPGDRVSYRASATSPLDPRGRWRGVIGPDKPSGNYVPVRWTLPDGVTKDTWEPAEILAKVGSAAFSDRHETSTKFTPTRNPTQHDEYVELLKRAAKEVRKKISAGLAERHHPHASFIAEKALAEVSSRYNLPDHGVEGFLLPEGQYDRGVSYLNMGDTYSLTICVITTRNTATVYVRSWGDIVEASMR